MNFIMFSLFLFFTLVTTTEMADDKSRNNFPWIGVLRLTTSINKKALTVLIVIQKGVAIANAYEMATLSEKKELRTKTTASFLSKKREKWKCKVRDVIFHPEYNAVTKNTIALVFLKPESKSYWDPIRLPGIPLSGSEDANFIGITDKIRSRLILSVRSMDSVERKECDTFYEHEGLDSKWMRPVHYSCYRIRNEEETCLNDAGMVLATPENGGWTMLGTSVYGPGCSLPARFIEIFPYTPWIKSYIPTSEDDNVEIVAMGTRRFLNKYQSSNITGESFDDRDSIILNKLWDDSIVLKYRSRFDAYEEHGDCDQSSRLIYEETGKIKMGFADVANAVYSVSIYDIRVKKINCVKMHIKCKAWSGLKVYYSKGFEEEDWESFIQVIPRNDLYMNSTNSTKRILYVQDEWMNHVEIETITVWLKFHIVGSASLSAKFYGKTKVRPTTTLPTTIPPYITTTTVETTTMTRKKRIYATFLKSQQQINNLRTGAHRINPSGRIKINDLTASTNKHL